MGKLRIKQIKSSIGASKHQKAILDSLGLHRLQQTVEHDNTPVIMGMVRKLRHLLTVEEIN